MNRRGIFGCDDIIGEDARTAQTGFPAWITMKTGPLVLRRRLYYLEQLYQSLMILSKDTLPDFIFMLQAPLRTHEEECASLGKYAEVP
jgi:hypothetical protein